MYNLYVRYMAADDESRQAFYREVEAAGIIEATRNEEGNIGYDYYFSAERENEILLMEQWKDKAAQEYHDELPHIAALMEIKKKYKIETTFEEV